MRGFAVGVGTGALIGWQLIAADRRAEPGILLWPFDGSLPDLLTGQGQPVAEVRAEHQILQRLGQGRLAFRVPEPVAAPDGRTVIETPAGPAAVCRWLPGVRPGMDGEAAFERFGRAAGLLGGALADVLLTDAVRDWRTDPPWSSRATRRSTSYAASCARPG